MEYRTLLKVSGIHHSNVGLKITHDMYINGYFMLLFDLTPERTASGHMSHPDNCNSSIELTFSKHLSDAITCILCLEFDSFVRVDYLRSITTEF